VVREQCWLNHTLSAVDWTVEGIRLQDEDILLDDLANAEADLEAVLSGMHL